MTIFAKAFCIATLFTGFAWANEELKVGSSVVPHADILKFIKPTLQKQGYDLKIYEFNDGVIPNIMVENGELDANYFQHEPYLKEFNQRQGTHLVKVASIHIEPMAVYSKKHKEFQPKTGASISIPNNPTNESRALRIVASAGLIEIKDSELVTPLDIVKNPKNLKFVELKDAQLTRSLNDVDYSLINSNFAILSGLNPIKDGLYTENKYSEYGNIIAVKAGNEELDKIKALVKALQSDEVKNFIEEKYQGALIPTF
ncbi:MetQ/NlpA family ABC transporter substrate-binding protein [Campylobacter coli]|uniref:MetQ/NlpA family ABC transporter substrate-binding protein n=1 Tax=Campylobacter coli TaxID=195 RepID=UPI00070DF384|nr:MetQ/NlpA family ABC transporter substrate-binding protein [Campylobacter coli]ECL1936052.1 MetQ/NlpA family ABC transporter substrate-binding protein [Campylobacter coli]ECR2494674.1 MetQ/NlpA family ABC transporter substrate-binding protein [Campylobacter coli]ECR3106392.1 MetQ/NlpA family ABC transporter substrate-binding protein [Campylobacter coli]EDB1538518.1 MetQ/NlpA family ABC transporter substrate-binding protein [Campylobacter coli]ELV0446518.1 MetQ/NlpA family ABC transporter su